MKIFLDDQRRIPPGYVGISTPCDCIELILTAWENGIDIKELSLDHDLGIIDPKTLEEETGYDVLVWLEENIEYMPDKVVIHTDNPVGRRRMNLVLESIKRRIEENINAV